MLNHERGTATVTCEAPRPTNPQVLREQFEHLRVGGCAISVGIHPLNRETTTALMPRILLCRSSAGSPQQTTNPVRQGEEGRNDALHFFPCHFFTLWRSEVLVRQRNGNAAKRKDAVDKTSNRAGATPLFRLSAAQKVRGVAPALGTLVACPGIAAQVCGKQFVMQAALHLEKEKEKRTWHY